MSRNLLKFHWLQAYYRMRVEQPKRKNKSETKSNFICYLSNCSMLKNS